MAQRKIPQNIRPLFEVEEEPELPADKPEIANRPDEARRVVKRISTIIDEHHEASRPLGVELNGSKLHVVIYALRDHAKGGSGTLDLADRDEIQAHCLQRLFDELVEEPSNILYVTKTGPDSERYDAMDSEFWLECLDLLETITTSN